MRTRYKLTALVLSLLAIAAYLATYKAYNAAYNVIPESKEIGDLKVEELSRTGETKLKISGFPFYSGMVVRSISTKRAGPIITVSLHMALVGLAQPRRPGRFEYELTVPDSVDEVRFGRDAKPIWRRGATPTS